MEGPLTLCLLFYGDFPVLAHRCLDSIWSRLAAGREFIQDFRIGLNETSPATRSIVDWFVENTTRHYGLPVITYDCPQNACKYPLMRRMLTEDPTPPAEWAMWFDDDSFLIGDSSWWSRLLDTAKSADMLGKVYTYPMLGQQWDWIQRQSWFNPAVGQPPKHPRHRRPAYKFITGGWWLLRSSILIRHDWPTRELRHCGGDTMLGELCRHQNFRLLNFEQGVRINASEGDDHQTSPRRGVSELHLGRVANAEMPNHNFECIRMVHTTGGNHG